MRLLEADKCTAIKIDEEAWRIGNAFLKGILLEVSAYPKPGLVCAKSMGAHKDMNILTFMISSATIGPAFYLCAQTGRDHQGKLKELFQNIRKIGVRYEKELMLSTKGVNTQRGILFAAGIMCAAAGYLSRYKETYSIDEVFGTVSEMAEGIVCQELMCLQRLNKKRYTAGEQLYLKYQVTGIRGEVESGFPSVRNVGLPVFKGVLQRSKTLNECLVHTLLALMACVEDTTILWRKDKDALLAVQKSAQKILDKGSIYTSHGRREIYELNKEFIKENISPGGSADLLSITVGSYLLENNQFYVKLM